jgi:putative multicomponent Na+:H+ antiporter subunit B
MTKDLFIYAIALLLPLSAGMVVFQGNPYHALIMRGILGAIAALTYTILGAADVALTEALVGTLLAIMLYAVAVRSSLVMRLGILEEDMDEVSGKATPEQKANHPLTPLLEDLRLVLKKHYMRLELVPYVNWQALQRSLSEKEVHAICARSEYGDGVPGAEKRPYQTVTRIKRLYDFMGTELTSTASSLSYKVVSAPQTPHIGTSPLGEEQS